MTCIKESLIKNAGRGVFATKSYKKGDYICFYDCRIKDIETLDDFIYSIKNSLNDKIYVGFKDIRTSDGVGQIINDYSIFTLDNEDRDENGLFKLSSKKIDDKIEKYIQSSLTNANVAYDSDKNNCFKMYAIKDINENDELYSHYGIFYWINKIYNTTNQPFVCLYCLLKTDGLEIQNDTIYLDNEQVTPKYLLENILGILPNGDISRYLNLEKYANIEKVKLLISMIQ